MILIKTFMKVLCHFFITLKYTGDKLWGMSSVCNLYVKGKIEQLYRDALDVSVLYL